ncbi:MAG: hypothetical protein AAGB31_11110 [Bdellovibrio sp.]
MRWMIGLLISLSMFFASFANSASKTQTITGTIQGLGYADPSATIEIAADGRGTTIRLGSTAHLQELGLTKNVLAMGMKVTAVGRLSKGNTQDELEAESLVINGQTYKLK